MEHNPPPNIPEDYKVWAKVSTEDREFSVPCKIYLPKTILEKPQIYIFPERKQFDVLPRLKGTCRFTATKGNPPDLEIVGEDTHISGGSMRHWGEGLEEGYLKIYPARLIVRHFNRTSSDNTVWFRLTPSIHLSPWDAREYHYSGSAKINYGERFQFKLMDDFIVTFLNYYNWQEVENKKTITFSDLLAEAKFERILNEDAIVNYLSIFDDFLLLVSFAEGQRCMIPQINIFLPDKSIEIYCLDRSLPNISTKHSFNDFLIDTNHLKMFLTSAWEIYRKSKQHDLIKAALEINTSDAHRTMESHFLALFSSIETLILAFRLENNLEYIVHDHVEWKALKGNIKKLIKEHEILKNKKNDRALMYQNINGLNRVPLQYAFKMFLAGKNIELNDLWPFSAEKSDCSLTKIRNRLVHGYDLNERYIDSFGKSLESLEYCAQRLLLVSLGWDFDKSKLFRRGESFIKSWKEAIEVIRNWE